MWINTNKYSKRQVRVTIQVKIYFNYIYIESSHNTVFQWFYNFDVWWEEGEILLRENKNSATCCSIQVMRRETEEHE